MELRGFDSYTMTLGDEMRGERASLGKSIEDAERDLRIKRRMLVAIENCDLEGFPNRSVVAGYVRSYARYLGMDAEDCYQRFCAESGYQSPVTMMLAEREAGAGRQMPLVPGRGAGAELACSRFAAPPARSRFMAPVSLGAVTSTLALVALMGGLSYGSYALLQDIQRVGFAPIPEAPDVVAEAPLITAPAIDAGDVPLPQARDYQDGGILAAMAPAPLQPIEMLRRDGPISAIDPRTAGVFAQEDGNNLQQIATVDSADDAIRAAALLQAAPPADPTGAPAFPGEGLLAAGPAGAAVPAAVDAASLPMPAGAGEISLHASEDAWIRIRERERDTVIFEGILAAGQQFELPPRTDAAVLKAGNAGGVFVLVDGVPYGPLGPRGQIARDVSLAPDDIRGSMPQAVSLNMVSARGTDTHQRAEAVAARQ